QTDAVAAFMRQNPNTSGVTVMVTHFVNISALTNADVSSGEMVVMQVAEDGQLAVLGSLEAL
ncbi:MAG: histidine phosphatase family protein, partial [Cyanobacteria bacterium P01_C01_bin.73]